MSRKKSKPKPRTTYITMDMGKPAPATGLHFNTKTGEFMLLNNGTLVKPEKVTIDTGYERSKGHKSLNKGNLAPDKVYSNPDRILELYDVIYAIDTNYRMINSVPVAVTGIVGGRISKPGIPNHTTVRFRPLKCLEFRNPKGKVENLGWHVTIEMILRAPDFSIEKRVACIVDSDLGSLEQYNSYSVPIYENYYLPQNFQLIYASSDSGKENIANQMIALADRNATSVFKIIEAGTDTDLLEPSKNNEPYSHIRVWIPINDKLSDN